MKHNQEAAMQTCIAVFCYPLFVISYLLLVIRAGKGLFVGKLGYSMRAPEYTYDNFFPCQLKPRAMSTFGSLIECQSISTNKPLPALITNN